MFNKYLLEIVYFSFRKAGIKPALLDYEHSFISLIAGEGVFSALPQGGMEEHGQDGSCGTSL